MKPHMPQVEIRYLPKDIFEIFDLDTFVLFFKCAQFLLALFIILVDVTVTLFSEKCLFPFDAYVVPWPTNPKNLRWYLMLPSNG